MFGKADPTLVRLALVQLAGSTAAEASKGGARGASERAPAAAAPSSSLPASQISRMSSTVFSGLLDGGGRLWATRAVAAGMYPPLAEEAAAVLAFPVWGRE